MRTETIIKGRMIEQNVTGINLAKKLGICNTTLTHKLKEEKQCFSLNELRTIVKVLNLSDEEIIHLVRR